MKEEEEWIAPGAWPFIDANYRGAGPKLRNGARLFSLFLSRYSSPIFLLLLYRRFSSFCGFSSSSSSFSNLFFFSFDFSFSYLFLCFYSFTWPIWPCVWRERTGTDCDTSWSFWNSSEVFDVLGNLNWFDIKWLAVSSRWSPPLVRWLYFFERTRAKPQLSFNWIEFILGFLSTSITESVSKKETWDSPAAVLMKISKRMTGFEVFVFSFANDADRLN